MTVLPRKLTFAMDGSEITLVAGGRRLRGLVKASKDIKGVTGVLGKALSPEEPDVVSGLRSILDQFTSRAAKLTVESAEPDAMGDLTEAGLTAESLANDWDVSVSVEPTTGMTKYIRACGSLATAWVILSDDAETSNGGDGAKLEALKTALDQQWAQFSQSVDQLTGEHGFICLNNALSAAGSVAIAKNASEAALICYDPDNMADLHLQWAAVTA